MIIVYMSAFLQLKVAAQHMLTLKERLRKNLRCLQMSDPDAGKCPKKMLGCSHQSTSAKPHLNFYLQSNVKEPEPKEICKDDLYFDTSFNLNH